MTTGQELLETLDTLAEPDKRAVAEQAMQTLSEPAKKSLVMSSFDTLSEGEQKDVANYAVQSLAPPTQKTVDNLWYVIVGTFAALMLGGVILVFILVLKGDETSVIAPFVSAALGVLAGLLAPSPVKTS
jgi:hypothetical protein